VPEPALVLVVDDDDADIELIRDAVDGHQVPSQGHVVRDGVEALGYLRAGGSAGPRPDMILLDLSMPRMDGREVLSAVKKDPGLADIHLVAQPRLRRSGVWSAEG